MSTLTTIPSWFRHFRFNISLLYACSEKADRYKSEYIAVGVSPLMVKYRTQ